MNTSAKYCYIHLVCQLLLITCLQLLNVSVSCSDHVLLFVKVYVPVMLTLAFVLINTLVAKKSSKYYDSSKIVILVNSLIGSLIGSCVYHVISFLLGAPLIENFEETFHFAVLLSTLSIFPLFVLHDGKWEDVFNNLASDLDLDNSFTDSIKIICVCTCIGAWIGAFPIPLDWDQDWQKWPITCCIGTVIGNFVGSSFVLFLNSSLRHVVLPTKKDT